ncbi:hypothetical protein FQN60_008268 [Etheostoma spectabile]|uniref:Uncharacterized protein n=1 Tax=Etheostoma spectabile TaxID=54343 RepID=A0A5J5CUM0_9PERO|nr:hypothetical protein FQN60_008268 [Etheostoma spectabile]
MDVVRNLVVQTGYCQATLQPKQPVRSLWRRLFLVLLLHQCLHQSFCDPSGFKGCLPDVSRTGSRPKRDSLIQLKASLCNLPAAAAAAPEPKWRVPSPPCIDRDKRPDSPAEHCPLSLSVPSCTAVVVVVVVVVAGALGKNEARTGTNI